MSQRPGAPRDPVRLAVCSQRSGRQALSSLPIGQQHLARCEYLPGIQYCECQPCYFCVIFSFVCFLLGVCGSAASYQGLGRQWEKKKCVCCRWLFSSWSWFWEFFFFSVVAFTHTRKRFIEEFQLSELVLVRGSIKLQLWHPFTGSFCIFEFFFIFFLICFSNLSMAIPSLPSLSFILWLLTHQVT